jgi:hypothetical protein
MVLTTPSQALLRVSGSGGGRPAPPFCPLARDQANRGGVQQHLDRSSGQPIFDNGGGVDKRIVPVQEPLLLDHPRPLVPEVLQELAQDDDCLLPP